jgi:hypothetical protein
MLLLWWYWQSEVKSTPFTQSTFSPNASALLLHDTLANR